MIIEILIAVLLGVIAGTFTGLAPGIHVNLVSMLVVSASAFFIPIFGIEAIVTFIIAMAITHSFLDVIPSIFLGAPSVENALSVLPGHRLLLEGKGYEAVKLTIIGSLFGLLFCVVCYVLLEKVLFLIYPFLENYIWQMIFIVALFMLFFSGNVFRNVFVFLSAGILGILVFGARINEPLFPLLTGMFGIATLLFSLKEENHIPEQSFDKETRFSPKLGFLSVVVGAFLGFFTAVLPGIGGSTAATAGSLILKEKEAKNFLLLTGAITTVNFFMSIAALNVLGKARNGAIVSLMQLVEKPPVLLMLFASLLSAGMAVFVALSVSKGFIKLLRKMDYALVAKGVIAILFVLTLVFSGIQGMFVLLLATGIGLYCNKFGVPKSTMMACIMLPVMIYFI
ncbi:MAG: tripartite tricarboxylate transporter permease [Candidatus Nanoarchaeia archaeon]